ncbi:hypothetical protein SAY86_012547 [Trapa natans]|uniref:Uncharacterized protein n=1 Tax=Trapa natans TaxID=22666 RepID=A0AAN7RDF6_TRANT|nr:hypothetical protein SAY86_012547 [Trapa natans]
MTTPTTEMEVKLVNQFCFVKTDLASARHACIGSKRSPILSSFHPRNSRFVDQFQSLSSSSPDLTFCDLYLASSLRLTPNLDPLQLLTSSVFPVVVLLLTIPSLLAVACLKIPSFLPRPPLPPPISSSPGASAGWLERRSHMAEAGTSGATDLASKEVPPSTSDKDDPLERLSSSSDSSSCASFDPFQLDERATPNLGTISSSFKLEAASPIPVRSSNGPEEPSFGAAAPSGRSSLDSSSSSGSITQSPQVQVMEKDTNNDFDNNGDSSSPSPYRIPSSVFARTKSTTPQEWSVTSNESLFSIQMGNISFNNDLHWICKSGELGKGGGDQLFKCPSPPLMDYSSNHQSLGGRSQQPAALFEYTGNPPSPKPAGESIDIFKKNTKVDEGLHATPEAVETMKAVLRENADDNREKTDSSHNVEASSHSPPAISSSHRSSASGASTKSFAFPILTGDGRKSGGSSKAAADSLRQNSQSVRPQNPDQQAPKKTQSGKMAAPAETTKTRWFSCFPCCPCS